MNDFATINRLVTENVRLAHFFANQFAWKLGEGEALSLALEGLHRAAEDYDLAKGIAFGTYASLRIKWRFSRQRLYAMRQKRGGDKMHLSLDAPLGEDGGQTFGDVIADDREAGGLRETECDDLEQKIDRLLGEIPQPIRLVLVRRFGLQNSQRETLDEIGRSLGITREAVRLRERRGLELLAAKKRRHGLSELYAEKPAAQAKERKARAAKPRHVYSRSGRSVEYGPWWKGNPLGLFRGMYLRDGLLDRAKECLLTGKGNRNVARLMGMKPQTVARLRKAVEIERGATILCACGRPATHRGWCRVRYAASPARQAFIKRWSHAA